MSTPTPTEAAAAGAGKVKGIGKALSGHPKWVYVVVIAGAVAMAYYLRQRQNAQTENAGVVSGPDSTSDPYGGYGTTSAGDPYTYPGGSQGAYYGGDTPQGTSGSGDPNQNFNDLVNALATLAPIIGGGGAPVSPGVDAHTVPTADPVIAPAPAVTVPVAPAPTPTQQTATTNVPHVISQKAQPILGPGIFYNATRDLRYIIQRHSNGKNYRHYESKLNKGDWGSGGVIPQ